MLMMNNRFIALDSVDENGNYWDESLSYSYTTKRWYSDRDEYEVVEMEGQGFTCYPASAHVTSLRAAVRHLRAHPEIPDGSRFRLMSRYVGFDVYLTKHGDKIRVERRKND